MKYAGKIGFALYRETSQDVWEEQIIEKPYYGDVIRNRRNWRERNEVNDNLILQNEISIVADSFAVENVGYMKYATLNGVKWKITDADINRPRINLTLGGVWNGKTET